ncbi:MAG: aminotransferase class V-fold PLP-dependent enzyme, partial [Promicromonosporaceae bacterium]|nr:aminotransferase class V-fold PLP-dependent enzyme [Promicromonosporaceae bacterium]
MDQSSLRAQFPILGVPGRGGRALNYLDTAATAQKPLAVIDAELEFYRSGYGPVHRGAHLLAEGATEAFEAARADVAALVGARPDEMVWTAGATAGLNL